MKLREWCLVAAAALALLPVTGTASEWKFRLSPYLWFAGLEGDIAAVPGLPPAPVDISPSQALEDTETAYMVMFDARRSRHGLYLDFIYTDVRSDEEIIPELNLSIRSVTKSTIFTAAYEHSLLDSEAVTLDALIGARYWEVDSKLSLSGPLGLSGGSTEDWVDPLIGIKGRYRLGDSRFYLSGGAGVGGFDVGSKTFYEVNLNLGYQWNDAIGTAIGYRLFDVDYDESGFKYDVKQQGWGLGLTWSF